MSICQPQIDAAWVEFRTTLSRKVLVELQALLWRFGTKEIGREVAHAAVVSIFQSTSGFLMDDVRETLEQVEVYLRSEVSA